MLFHAFALAPCNVPQVSGNTRMDKLFSGGTSHPHIAEWSFPEGLGARWPAYYAPNLCAWLPEPPSVETFVVEEVRFSAHASDASAGSESGSGTPQHGPEPTAFTLVHIEKRNLTTTHAASRIARAAGIHPREVNFAGQKDKASRARQWLCLPTPAWQRLAAMLPTGAGPLDPDLDILCTTPARKRLKLGQLVGNRFAIALRLNRDTDPETHAPPVARLSAWEGEGGALYATTTRAQPTAAAGSPPHPLSAASTENLRHRLTALQRRGCPNYFGPQRFRDVSDAAAVEATLRGDPPQRASALGPRDVRFDVSLCQSIGFNDTLANRLRHGLGPHIIEGDILRYGQRSDWRCYEAASLDWQDGTRQWQPTAPLPGYDLDHSAAAAGLLEASSLHNRTNWLTRRKPRRKLATGTRRPVWIYPDDLSLEMRDTTLWLTFALPRGSYASCVLRELFMSTDTPSVGIPLE